MRVWGLCGLYGLACCWVLRQQASCPFGGGGLVFQCLSCVFARWSFGVLWGSWPVLRGCGVVVWELYSEREHLIR